MSRRIAVILILIAAIAASTTVSAQQRPYDQIMKDIQSTFATLKKSLDASGVTAAAAAGGRGGAAPVEEPGQGGRGPGTPPANWDPAIRDTAVQDAAKLQSLFKETETFWAKFDTQDAMKLAKSAQDAADQVAVAAKGNDPRKAQTAYGAIQKTCGTCHLNHREETGKGFFIKP